MALLTTDVSSWNPDTPAFFKELARRGVKAAVVKLTEGRFYQNPKALAQIKAAAGAGMYVHAYHYAKFQTAAEAVSEAKFFIQAAKKYGLNASSVLALDAEDLVLPANLTLLIKLFLNTVSQTYPRTDLYTMAAWLWSGRINLAQLPRQNLWVARYGADRPGVANVGTWQFTANYAGLNVDMSDDFFGYYTRR